MTVSDRMLVGGERPPIDPARAIEVRNPFTGATVGCVGDATPQQVAAAVTAAADAFDRKWRKTSGAERGRLMMRLADVIERQADELAAIETADNGKLLRETRTQVRFAARTYRFFAGLADKVMGRTIPLERWDAFDYTVREPVGVAALITAWNSPMQLLANKLAPALAAGCTVVVKPSELAPRSTLRLADIVAEAGFPPGVINVITGGPAAGAALTADPRLGHISVTGGVSTGRAIAAAASRTLVPMTLELGGKSANIVFDDADLDRAVVGAVSGVFAAGGQTCVAGSRLLVHAGVYHDVVDAVATRARRIVLGDPTDPATEMGPVGNAAAHARILAAIEAARGQGARLVAGGGPPCDERLAPGLFIEPTVFADVDLASTLARDEVFGPVLAVIPFADEAEAISIANGTDFGLAAGVWTHDLSRAHRVARELVAGTVWINTYRFSAVQAPFGGVKQSGYGRERGVEAIDQYLRTKNVMIDLSADTRDPFSMKT